MNKGKIIFIVVALSMLTASVWVYFGQTSQRVRQNASESVVKARISGFELYRYVNDDLKARVSGEKARLEDPARLICDDKIVAVRIRDGIREELEADKARILFTGDSLFTQKDSTLDTLELEGDVEFVRGRSHFVTEWLQYTEKTGEAFTDQPVRVDSSGQFIAAEGGMTYNLQEESIRLRGGVFGSLRTDAIKNGLRGKGSQ